MTHREMSRRGGSAKTAAKIAASRRNVMKAKAVRAAKCATQNGNGDGKSIHD